MKNGSYFYWEHFWWGLVIGAGLGVWIARGIFDSPLACIGLGLGIALFVALCSGKWGDEFWREFLGNGP